MPRIDTPTGPRVWWTPRLLTREEDYDRLLGEALRQGVDLAQLVDSAIMLWRERMDEIDAENAAAEQQRLADDPEMEYPF